MNRESITFTVTDEREANGLVTLKVTHSVGVGDKPTSIDWYTRQDGKWAQAGLSAGPGRFLSADWCTVPDQLLRAMGVDEHVHCTCVGHGVTICCKCGGDRRVAS